MKVGGAFPSKYLKADDLEDQDWVVTIRAVVMENVGQGASAQEKLIIYFKEHDAGLVVNKTNANTITKVLGTDETDDWIGRKITLWPNHDVQFKDEIVSAIRVRSKAPTPIRPPKKMDKIENVPPEAGYDGRKITPRSLKILNDMAEVFSWSQSGLKDLFERYSVSGFKDLEEGQYAEIKAALEAGE